MKISIVSVRIITHVCLVILISLFFIACDKSPEKPGPTPAPAPTTNLEEIEAARTAMVDWLECEECTENQLETVLKHSKRLQPMLISTLQKGVAPASQELYRRELEKRYDELVIYSKTHPHSKPTLPKPEFVNLYLSNLTAQYQTRAAKALSAIGGETSKQALQESLKNVKREDVIRAIELALKDVR